MDKPAGLNTHSPDPFASEGLFDWLRNREPRWAGLSIVHRLDKETSGLIVFGKTTAANRSLTAQFTDHTVQKSYVLLTRSPVSFQRLEVKTALVRAGEKYHAREPFAGAEIAQTTFRVLSSSADSVTVIAEPLTGKTHQIRVQASARGFPILGDRLYGGAPWPRLCLHARQLAFKHPATGEMLNFGAPEKFARAAAMERRRALIPAAETDSCRLRNGAADGQPDWYVDRFGDFLLAQSIVRPDAAELERLGLLMEEAGARGVYHKSLRRGVSKFSAVEASPQWVMGARCPEDFLIRENGLRFQVRFQEGYSVGLFLDQRDNRRRLITGYINPEFFVRGGEKPSLAGSTVLNTFAYTCAFSVCAASAGARVTSLDLSRKYLDWGRRNFTANGLDLHEHEFICGDVFAWLRRLGKKQRIFDVVLLDPPTFSQSKESGTFRVEKDYGKLILAATPLVSPGGILFCSTNAAKVAPAEFMAEVRTAIAEGGRRVLQEHFSPAPPDFPTSREEPAYLKTLWFRLQ